MTSIPTPQNEAFEGFEPANTTPVPDILFDELLAKLSGAEIKVLLYIIRRTWGFKKETDAISLSQFQNGITKKGGEVLDKGCGIKRRETICQALDSLTKKGYIKTQKNQDSAGDKATTVYGIRFKEVVSKPDYLTYRGSHQTGLPSSSEVVSKPDYVVPKTGLRVVSKPDPQETVIQGSNKGESNYVGENGRAASAAAPLRTTETQSQKGIALHGNDTETPRGGERPTVHHHSQPGSDRLPAQKTHSVSATKKPTSTAPTKETGQPQKNKIPDLTLQEKIFWSLWEAIDQHDKIKPKLTQTAAGHVRDLAPHVTTQEEMNSLVTHTRAKLREKTGKDIWQVELGNCRTHFADWDKQRQKVALNGHTLPNIPKAPAPPPGWKPTYKKLVTIK